MAIRHNHRTRDIKEPGKCLKCDQYHFSQGVHREKSIAFGELRTMYKALLKAYHDNKLLSMWLIQGLAQQQAMEDDWYLDGLMSIATDNPKLASRYTTYFHTEKESA